MSCSPKTVTSFLLIISIVLDTTCVISALQKEIEESTIYVDNLN